MLKFNMPTHLSRFHPEFLSLDETLFSMQQPKDDNNFKLRLGAQSMGQSV